MLTGVRQKVKTLFIMSNSWVDYIRRRGNEANHEIALMYSGDAEALVAFVEMILKFIYEFPSKVPRIEMLTD